MSNLTIVMRCAGERTEQLCRSALESQVDAPIHIVRERPFAAALRRSVRIGIEAGRELTLCVDADIIMAPHGVERMVAWLGRDPDAFFICGFFLDKYYGEPKSRGAHLYRTRYLEEAERGIPSDSVQRPETVMKQSLLSRGVRGMHVEGNLLGLHGYGQYYRDTFRTIACRGQKSPGEFAALMKRFSRHAGTDGDLRVAMWALVASLEAEYSLDAQHWGPRVDELLSASEMSEKSDIGSFERARLLALAALCEKVPLGLGRRFRVLRERLREAT